MDHMKWYKESIQERLNRLDKYEARRKKRIEQMSRDVIIVDAHGHAEVTYLPEDKFDRMERLYNRSHMIVLLWDSRYAETYTAHEMLWIIDYVFVVANQRVGLRKSLSCYAASYIDPPTRHKVRYQIDGIIKALEDIDELTKGES